MSSRNTLYDNDVRFSAWARTLTAADWAAPSLCREWTNHDVLAHLVVGYSATVTAFAVALVRRRGAFDPANADLARSLAESRSPDRLLDDFARYRDRPEALGRWFPKRLLIGDHVTHELDICHALGRTPAIPEPTLIVVLNTQVSLPNPFVPAYRNSRGLRLVAEDADWSHGRTGPEVRGSAAALVSALGNRPAVLDRLTGDGAEVLAARVRATGPSRTAG